MWPVRNGESRILVVASAIDKIQLRRSAIAKEVVTLEARLDKLSFEETDLAAKQVDLARQMDKLTVGSSIAS